MSAELLLVGSIPYESSEKVFRTFGKTLGPNLIAAPDGEVGFRRHWISRIHYQVFALHPDLEVIRRPALEDGVERLHPRDASDSWQFRVRDSVERIRFGEPGWRLGYARDAINSYFVFKTLREKGELPSGLPFQVSIASPNSAAPPRLFPTQNDCRIVREAYQEAVAAEVAAICRHIPHDDLAIQWDCATEVQDAYGAIAGLSKEDAIERNTGQIAALSPQIPEAVKLGYHLCFGTLGGWPRFSPEDMSATVDLANAFIAASGRRVDWMHIPILNRTDDAFYAPLQRLAPQGARIYLGMVHHMDSFAERLAVARRHLPDFGLAAYCGLGRTPPEGLEGVLDEHLQALKISGRGSQAAQKNNSIS
jgi:hypothetical protein